jgi:hypothetical protein
VLGPKVLVIALGVFGCGSRPTPVAMPAAKRATAQETPCADGEFGSDDASFVLEPADLRAGGASPELLAKFAKSPYAYFRALARPYELRTCAGLRDQRWRLPVLAIHGDAHIEQFVVTPTTAGLEDFDQSGYGPAGVDLVRYAASIHLACHTVTWPCSADRIVTAYFDAYRAALDHEPARSTPSIAERLRRATPVDHARWFGWAEGLLRPLPHDDEQRALSGWQQFRELELELHPERRPAYYDIVRIGGLQLGIGSVLETKLLLRLSGPTDASPDDVLVEARAQSVMSGKSCASRPLHGGALQPLTFMALLGPRLPEVFGYAALGADGAPDFWVQSWVAGYHELSVNDLENERELVELAEDAARQLAGHFWLHFPAPLRALQRHAQLRAFDATAPRARDMARSFADETLAAWEHFRAELAR